MRVLAAFLVCIASLAAQTPRTSDPGQGPTARESLRIERLQTLADLWGTLWLIHPYVVATNVDWDKVLIDAIPQVERAGSTEVIIPERLAKEMAALLNLEVAGSNPAVPIAQTFDHVGSGRTSSGATPYRSYSAGW